MATKKLLSRSGMEKLLKVGGADRVSEDAKDAMKEVLEERAEEVARRALQLAQHAGRITVKGEDIRLAIKNLK